MLAEASCRLRRCALAVTTRDTAEPASSGPKSNLRMARCARSVRGTDGGLLSSSGWTIGRRCTSSLRTSRLSTWMWRARSAMGDQRREICSAVSQTPRSSLSSSRPSSSWAGKAPPSCVSRTRPSDRLAVERSNSRRPAAVLPATRIASSSNRINSASEAAVQPRIFSAARIRRPVPVRCRSRTHHRPGLC